MNEVWKKHPSFMEYYEVSNLEWCTNKENHNHGTGHLRTTQHPNYIKSRKELSEKMKGIPKSIETRKKISEALRNK